MLPFLKKEAAVAMPVETITREPDEGGDEFNELEGVAQELISAVHSKDAKALAAALQAAFEICESYPHEEGA